MTGTVLLLLLASAAAVEPDSNLERVLEEARRAQERDLEAWHRFRFRRLVTREKLDSEGKTRDREDLDFRITPHEDGFDEELVLRNGETPKPSLVRKHRKAARFTERYRAALPGGEASGEYGDAFSLFHLLRVGRQQYSGQETMGGVLCHRLDFDPSENPAGKGRAAKIVNALAGTIWVDEKGSHVVRAEARATRPVSFAMGLARLTELEMSMESIQVEAGVWLPGAIRVRWTVRVLGVPVRRRNTFLYSDCEAALQRPPDERGATAKDGTE